MERVKGERGGYREKERETEGGEREREKERASERERGRGEGVGVFHTYTLLEAIMYVLGFLVLEF